MVTKHLSLGLCRRARARYISVSSTEVTFRVRTSSLRLVTGQKATSSRFCGRCTRGGTLARNGRRVRSIFIPGSTGLKYSGGAMLLSISTLRNSRSFTVFSVTPLSILSNCSLVNSRPATAAASRSMSFVSWGAAAVRAGGATSEGRASDGFPSDNRAQSTPGKSVEVKPSEEKYARNERRSVVRFMSKGNILPWRKEFVYCGSDKPYTAENGEEDRAAALRAPTGAAATLAMASRD